MNESRRLGKQTSEILSAIEARKDQGQRRRQENKEKQAAKEVGSRSITEALEELSSVKSTARAYDTRSVGNMKDARSAENNAFSDED